MKTPLGRVRGLGSNRGGTIGYLVKQLSGMLLLLLTFAILAIILYLAGRERVFVIEAMGSVWISVPLVAFLFLSALHMELGMRAILEDYVTDVHRRIPLMLLSWAFSWGLFLIALFAIIKMIFAGN
ncbi:succinate dehydrogenase, hydrophobic membrane anchor protein [Limoniibacter endophyticus]|uniref:Succinate dehydrogenase hydrophobic membrane anchor subunit n=1 Tax=Limoniibacter endophyticus TaxID=1565040 RepID=A0A8J3GIM7_9HYPH|nr:succinate dehydrogenase, hydrophobic membrane anchor protein [Limoniibacter endophyticus]GHC78390.1 succinate dehydrogenase, hydrophobic membrane anchor protein [Limoniibacter endophyticus]